MSAVIFTLLLLAQLLASPTAADSQNIARSEAIAQRVGDTLWPGWSHAPFGIDLQTPNGSVLLNSPASFDLPNVPPTFEATMVLGPNIPTIVIGEPVLTQAKTPIRWSVTLLHEHFHQWQYSWPQYQSAVKALGLAPPGDTNAMWMLNYPFPYADAIVSAAYDDMSHKLAVALTSIGTDSFRSNSAAYLASRSAFRHMLKPADYRYFAFQCWQEGTARYTEIMVGQFAAQAHDKDATFLNDADAISLREDSIATYGRVLTRLVTRPLKDDQRVDFYALGAGEALLLDQLSPGWRLRYLDSNLDLGAFFPPSD